MTKCVEENEFRQFDVQKVKTIVYVRDAEEMFQIQMRMIPASDIWLATANGNQHGTTTGTIYYSMNADIGHCGCHAAEKNISTRKSGENI